MIQSLDWEGRTFGQKNSAGAVFWYAQMEKFLIEVKSDYEYFKQYTEECDVMVSKMGTIKMRRCT